MTLDLRKYGQNLTIKNISDEIAAIGAQSRDIQYVKIVPGSSIPAKAFGDEYLGLESEFSNLEIVYNLNTCVSIGEYAFNGCSKLRNTDISKASTIG